MDAEDQLGGSVVGDQNGTIDRFPEGMRVLAIDDNPLCLKNLEFTLRQCHYEVTTANHAFQALEILRENRNKFDLVISDVQMPDMDGFQLLQLLGDEMDLPVIMVSGDGDTELIKKGISHGACCYLEKPVKVEVFKTIWQHVFRRKKLSSKDQCKSSDQDKVPNGTGEGEQVISPSPSDQNGKHKRKRKDQSEDDEEDGDDERENEEPSPQKKHRITWTRELHKKFLDVYYHLGPHHAVPKKIAQLMDVTDLSRGQVASHLQKFREQLKKSANDQGKQRSSVVVEPGRKDFSYMLRTVPVDESEFGRLSDPAPVSSYTPHRQMLCTSNSSTGVSKRRIISSSHLVRPSQSQNYCNSIDNVANLQPGVRTNQIRNLSPVNQTPVELNQLQQRNSTVDIGQSTPNNGLTATFPYKRLPGNSIRYDCNTLMLQGNPQQQHGTQVFGNQSSLGVNSLNPNNGYGESWHGGIQLSQFPSNALLRSEASNHSQLPANNLCVSYSTPEIGNNPNVFSSISALSAPAEELQENMHIQNQDSVVPSTYYTPKQWWEDHKQDDNHNLNPPSIGSTNGIVVPLTQSLDQNDAVSSMNISSLFDQCNGGKTTIVQSLEVENSTMQTKIDPNEDFLLLEQATSNDGFVQNSFEALNNQEQQENEYDFLDGEFGYYAIQEQKENDEYDLLDGTTFKFDA